MRPAPAKAAWTALPAPPKSSMNICRVPLFPPDEPPPRRDSNIAAPLPRPFDFGFTARTPLVPLPAAVLFLNRKQRAVMALIESGELRWAFDIRSAGASTREVRVLRDSLFEFAGLRERRASSQNPEERIRGKSSKPSAGVEKGRNPHPAPTPGVAGADSRRHRLRTLDDFHGCASDS